MTPPDLPGSYTHPVVIGGVGGSGTRLIARCLDEFGFFMGSDLKEAHDNLWFTLLFKRIEILDSSEEEFDELIEIFLEGMTGSGNFTEKQIDLINHLASAGRENHSASWLKKRARTLLSKKKKNGLMKRARTLLSKKTKAQPHAGWGWKEPNSHVILDRLQQRFRDMKYIHVVRNGLDMAHSRNQNQLKLWGRHFIGEDYDISPYWSLKYWCIVHRRVLEIGRSMGANFLFLNYDNFCLNPESGIKELCEFLGLDATAIPGSHLLELVHVPDSIGRFRQYGTKIFSEEDVAYVKELGFDIGET